MIITNLNQKGGVGKSDSSVNIAYSLALEGYKTLLIDLDPQGHSSDRFIPSKDEELTIKQAFINKTIDITSLVVQAQAKDEDIPNLFVIPSDITLAMTAEQITAKIHKEKLLFNHFKQVRNDYDYIILDCPPNLGVLTINAIFAGELIVIPVKYEKESLKGVRDLFLTLEEVREDIPYTYKILRNHYDKSTTVTNQYIEGVLEDYKEHTFNTRIRKCEAIKQASIEDLPIAIYAPKSTGTQDYKSLVSEIILLNKD
jgi:chromosome partitioning protein